MIYIITSKYYIWKIQQTLNIFCDKIMGNFIISKNTRNHKPVVSGPSSVVRRQKPETRNYKPDTINQKP